MDKAELRESETNGKTFVNMFYWAYTINISPHKKVLIHKDNKKHLIKWSGLSRQQQQNYLSQIIKETINTQIYFFELTEKKNIHVHGMFNGSLEDAHYFQNYVHKKCGFPKDNLMRVCYITPTEVDKTYYEEYMEKEKIYHDINISMFNKCEYSKCPITE